MQVNRTHFPKMFLGKNLLPALFFEKIIDTVLLMNYCCVLTLIKHFLHNLVWNTDDTD